MCSHLGIQKTMTTPLHPQTDGQQHNTEHLGDSSWMFSQRRDENLPLVLMVSHAAVQDSTACTPSLLMLGRELHTPADLPFGRPPDAPAVPAGPEYDRKLQDRLKTAHMFT